MISIPVVFLSLLCLGAEAGLVPRVESDAKSAVSIAADLPGSLINGQRFAANGGKIWIGKDTATYCPPTVEKQGACPKGKDTSFWVNDSCGMNTIVPGGQQAYIAPDGTISYTQPHSAYIPPGSTTTGFHLTPKQSNGPQEFGISSHQLMACPGTPGQGPWQVVAVKEDLAVTGRNLTDCLRFRALATPVQDAAVWEYI